MSLGYAERLSYRDDLGGQLGSEELSEPEDIVSQKIERLADMVNAQSLDEAPCERAGRLQECLSFRTDMRVPRRTCRLWTWLQSCLRSICYIKSKTDAAYRSQLFH